MVEQAPDELGWPALLGAGAVLLAVTAACVGAAAGLWESRHGAGAGVHAAVDPRRAAPMEVTLLEEAAPPPTAPADRFSWVDPDTRTVSLPLDVAAELVARER